MRFFFTSLVCCEIFEALQNGAIIYVLSTGIVKTAYFQVHSFRPAATKKALSNCSNQLQTTFWLSGSVFADQRACFVQIKVQAFLFILFFTDTCACCFWVCILLVSLRQKLHMVSASNKNASENYFLVFAVPEILNCLSSRRPASRKGLLGNPASYLVWAVLFRMRIFCLYKHQCLFF